MSWCLNPNLTDKVKSYLVDNKISAEDFSNMSMKDRVELLKKATESEKEAKQIEKAFTESPQGKKMITVATPEEAAKLTELSNKIEELKQTAQNDTLGTNSELLKARNELNKYKNSLNTKSVWKSVRDSLSSLYKNLFIGVKTGVKTTVLGTLNSFLEVIPRRSGASIAIGDIPVSTKLNDALSNVKLYGETGVNTFLQTSAEDNSAFGMSKGGLFESFGGKDTLNKDTTVAGKIVAKTVNTASRIVKWFAIDALHKAPMSVTSSMNFVDALDITSSRLAKTDYAKESGMSSMDIYKDALKVEPQTDLGKIARNRSQQDMFRVLNINNTPLSEATVKLQQQLNKTVPTLGNYVLPMAKVPSSVVYNELENFGLGLGTGIKDVITGTGELNKLKLSDKESTPEGVASILKIRQGVSTLIRTVGVMATAAIITQQLTKKDFYTDNYGNSYVKMGNNWLNTNAFGGAGTAVAGVMMAKTGSSGMVFDYGTAAFDSLGNAPLVDGLNQMVQEGKQGKLGTGLVNDFIDPVLANDIQKSAQEDSLNPLLVGTLFRTEEQKKLEDKIKAKKASVTKKSNKIKKSKTQTFFGN